MRKVFFGHPIYLGIYSIRNKDSGRILFGKSYSCRLEILNIITECEEGTHSNKQLQKDFKKLGRKGFEYKVHELIIGYTKKEKDAEDIILSEYDWNLDYRLRYWITKSRKEKIKLYNTSSIKKFVVLINNKKEIIFKSNNKKECCEQLGITMPTLNAALKFNNRILKYKYNNLYPIMEKDFEERKNKLIITL